MTAEPTAPEWIPYPLDLRNAIAAFLARVKNDRRASAAMMKIAAEDGRLFLMIDAMMWLLFKQYRFEEIPEALDRLEADLLKLAAMIEEDTDEEDNTDE
jgi:N-glycosylase/DNA lyase